MQPNHTSGAYICGSGKKRINNNTNKDQCSKSSKSSEKLPLDLFFNYCLSFMKWQLVLCIDFSKIKGTISYLHINSSSNCPDVNNFRFTF